MFFISSTLPSRDSREARDHTKISIIVLSLKWRGPCLLRTQSTFFFILLFTNCKLDVKAFRHNNWRRKSFFSIFDFWLCRIKSSNSGTPSYWLHSVPKSYCLWLVSKSWSHDTVSPSYCSYSKKRVYQRSVLVCNLYVSGSRDPSNFGGSMTTTMIPVVETGLYHWLLFLKPETVTTQFAFYLIFFQTTSTTNRWNTVINVYESKHLCVSRRSFIN